MTDTVHATCTQCGRTMPLSEFSPNRYHRKGVQSYCRQCGRERQRRRRQEAGYAENRAAMRAYRRLAMAHQMEYRRFLGEERSRLREERSFIEPGPDANTSDPGSIPTLRGEPSRNAKHHSKSGLTGDGGTTSR